MLEATETTAAMNQEKLQQLQAQVRIGGKGTARRKKKVVHRTATTDDKRLQVRGRERKFAPGCQSLFESCSALKYGVGL